MLVGDFVIVVVLFVCFCNLLSNDLSMGKILRGKYGCTWSISGKAEALCVNERAEAATSRYSATGYFLQYIYSVLVAKNHQKVRSRCLDHEFSFTYIFEWYYSWLQSSFIEEKIFVGTSVLYNWGYLLLLWKGAQNDAHCSCIAPP